MIERERSTKRARREPGPVTRASLERAALRYLERFDASVSKLRRVLAAHVARAAKVHETDRAEAAAWIDELLERYQASGILDDRRYAQNLAEGLRRRGSSQRGISQKLRARGLSDEIATDAVSRVDAQHPDAEYEAALRFARKRRLGRFRPAEERAERRSRDFAALARAGFAFDVARRVLGPGEDDDAF